MPTQVFRGESPVLNGGDFVSVALQGSLQQAEGESIIICDKNSHGLAFATQASNSGSRSMTSLSKSAKALFNAVWSLESPNCSSWAAAAVPRVAPRFESIPLSMCPDSWTFFRFP